MAEFTLTRRIDASPDVVFDTITDHRRYSDYTPIRRVDIEREGDTEPNGKGAIRALHGVGPPIRELVVAFDRPRLFRYEVLSGLARSGADRHGDRRRRWSGSLMIYRIEPTPTLSLTGPVFVGTLKVAIGRLMAAVQRRPRARPRSRHRLVVRPMRILFVCLGNICRSPTAEGVMRHKLARPASTTTSTSRAPAPAAGTSATRRTRRATAAGAARDPAEGAAQRFEAIHFDDFDLILAMDRQNFGDMRSLPHAATTASSAASRVRRGPSSPASSKSPIRTTAATTASRTSST